MLVDLLGYENRVDLLDDGTSTFSLPVDDDEIIKYLFNLQCV